MSDARDLTRERERIGLARKQGYYEGYRAALVAYAWWRDGEQYVGCGMETLQAALIATDRRAAAEGVGDE